MIDYEIENKGNGYLLTCVDIFSKYAWGIPEKNKTVDVTVKAFEITFKVIFPKKLQTDLGKEFYNSKMKQFLNKYSNYHFSSHSSLKASVFEMFNRAGKEKMWKYFSKVKHHCWVDVIDNLLSNCNNSYHSSIRMTPTEASKKENESEVRENLYPETKLSQKHKYKISDMVRIDRYKRVFDKGYQPNYTTEMFKICEVRNTNPNTYGIKDYNDEVIEGMFYDKELLKYNKKDDMYEVEKIMRKKKIKGNYRYLVKWKGYPESMNSWVDKIK